MNRRPSETTPVRYREGPPDEEGAVAGGDTNPFPGPRPFFEREGSLFFGRERELSDLIALLFAQRVMLLHGPSGNGKSSLVYAGLMPRARARGFEFLPVARVRDETAHPNDRGGANRYVHNVIQNWREAGLGVPAKATTLAEVIGSLPASEEPGRVMVFDQFEEIFVVHPECWKDRADLLLQVQAALDADPLLHVVFVLRDDYLARLQPLTPVLRDRLSTRYQLRGLSSAQALDAVVRPFAAVGRTFAPGVAENLVKAIRAQPAVAPDTRSYEGEDVEPVQLQIVCRTFFDRLPPDVVVIGEPDVARHADVDQALVGFYEQAVGAAVRSHRGARERRVRLWFERQLITPAHTRGIVYRDQRATAGLPNEVVDELERRRVVRSEPRGPSTWYELTHDRLVDAVLSSNRVWYAARSRTITRRSAAAGALGVILVVAALVAANVVESNDSTSANPEYYEISAPGETVREVIPARAGQEINAVMTPSEFAGSLRLLDGAGAAVAQVSQLEAAPLLLTFRVPVDGQYRLEAMAQGRSTGSFTLVYGAQTVDVASAPLTAGQPVPGTIAGASEVDLYTFSGPPGAVVHVTLTAEDDADTGLAVSGPGPPGAVDRGEGQSVLAFVIPQDGIYEVRASSLGSEDPQTRVAYRLDVELPDVSGGQAAQRTGVLGPTNRSDVYAVRSEGGGVVEVTLASALPTDLALLAPDGRLLVDAYIGDDESEGGFGPWPIAPAATYLVLVEWDQVEEVAYSLSTAVDDARPVSAGAKVGGELTRPDQLVAFRLESVQPGDVSILVVPGPELDVVLGIVRPDGTILIEPDSKGAGEDQVFTVAVPPGGPLLVVVGSDVPDQATGRFEVAVGAGG